MARNSSKLILLSPAWKKKYFKNLNFHIKSDISRGFEDFIVSFLYLDKKTAWINVFMRIMRIVFWRRDGVEIWDFTFLTLTRSCSIEFHHCTLVYFFKNLCPQRWAHDFFLFALYWCLSFSKRPIGLHYRPLFLDPFCRNRNIAFFMDFALLRFDIGYSLSEQRLRKKQRESPPL